MKNAQENSRPIVIDSPDDIPVFKIGMDNVDYQRLGLGDYLFPTSIV